MSTGFTALLHPDVLSLEVRVGPAGSEVADPRTNHDAGRRLLRSGLVALVRGGALPAVVLDHPLGRGLAGEPQLPVGTVGAVTHADGRVAVAVAARVRPGSTGVLGVGLDLHPAVALPTDVGTRVSGVAETAALTDLPDGVTLLGSTLAFSAKESVFKACYPLTGHWLEWDHLRVGLRPDGTFTVAFDHPCPAGVAPWTDRWVGGWSVVDGVVRTAVTVLADDPR